MPFNWLLFKNGFCARLKSSVCSQFRFLFRHLVLSRLLPWNDLIRWIILKDLNFYSNFWTIFRCKISIFDEEFEFFNEIKSFQWKMRISRWKMKKFRWKMKKFRWTIKNFQWYHRAFPVLHQVFSNIFLEYFNSSKERKKLTHSWLHIRIYIDLIDLFPSMLIGSSI